MPRSEIRRDRTPALNPRRVAFIRALHLGDMLCAIPALRALRCGFPNAQITLVGLTWSRDFLDRFPDYLHDFMEFPGYRGIPEQTYDPKHTEAFLAAARSRRFDLALQAHGDGSIMNAFALDIGASVTAGFHPIDASPPDPDYFISYPWHEPEVIRLLTLTDSLGLPRRGTELEFPVWESDVAEAIALLGDLPLEPGYVCIHPGSRSADRRWPAAGFAAVADALAARGYAVVLTGSAAERAVVAEVAGLMSRPALDLAGRTSLGGLAAVLQGARLLVANDTGASHLAAAVGTRSVIVFTGSDPARWAPLDAIHHRPLGTGRPDPLPCAQATSTGVLTPRASRRQVTPDAVIAEAVELLGTAA